MAGRARNQRLDLVAARDVAGNDMGVAAGLADALGDFLASLGLAAGDHHLGAELCEEFGEERPMPRLEPVMTATLPVRSNGVDFKFVSWILPSWPGLIRASIF